MTAEEITVSKTQKQLSELKLQDMINLLADVSVAIALKSRTTPHQVLKDAIFALVWSEEEWQTLVAPALRRSLIRIQEEEEKK